MKNVSKVRLSLRKFLVAAMAIGPLAVLPSPVWAALPSASQFTVTNGTVSLNTAGSVATFSASDRAVLVWTTGNFNIAGGDTWNFSLPSSTAAVLNKVGYNTNGTLGTVDTATIAGSLTSNGRVFLLANGQIVVNQASGNVINTAGGLVLSTLAEASDQNFINNGALTLTGAATGNITLSNALAVTGDLAAYTGNFVGGAVGGGTVSGNLVLRAVTAGAPIALGSTGALTVDTNGNLSVTTNNGAITQTNAITVNTTTDRLSTFSTGSTGTSGITLANASNNFGTVALTTNGSVSLTDSNAVILAASTIGGGLTVAATNNISTTGAVAVTGAAAFSATNNNISIGNSSSVGSTLTGSVSGGNSFTFNGTGDLLTGAISSTSGALALTTTGAITLNGALTTTGNVSATGTTVNQTSTGTIPATANVVTFNGTAGSVTLGSITAQRVVVTSNNGTISQAVATGITTSNATVTNSFNAGTAGTVNLNAATNNFHGNSTISVTAASANVITTNSIVVGTTNITSGNYNLTTTVANSNVTLGGESTTVGINAGNITVAGVLNITTSGTGDITDNNYSAIVANGGLNLTTGSGVITLDAATQHGVLSPTARFGAVSASTTGAVTVQETTTLNLGNITAGSLNARSLSGDIIDSGTFNITGAAAFQVGTSANTTIDGNNNKAQTVSLMGGADNSYVSNNSTVELVGNSSGNVTISSLGSGNITLNATVGGNLVVNSAGSIGVTKNTTVSGSLALTAGATGASSISQTTNEWLRVAGNTTISSNGGVDLPSNNDFTVLTLTNVAGDAKFHDITSLTVSGNVGGILTANVGVDSTTPVVLPYGLSLGNITASGISLQASGVGSPLQPSGAITQQSGTRLTINGASSFTTSNAPITLTNAGNNFGGVSLTAGNGTVSVTEENTLRLVTLSTSGNTTLTSTSGDIIETVNAATSVTANVLTLNATNGNVLLGGTTSGSGSIAGSTRRFVVNAPNGAVALFSSRAEVELGNITGLSLTVNHTGTTNLTQTGRISAFNAANVTSAGDIILSNTTNNFGRVSLTASTAGKHVTITEAGTLNLGVVSMPAGGSGNFTATSVSGDIIDTGLESVKIGGTAASNGSGVITLNASAGNITLDDTTTEFNTTGGVRFTGNAVTLVSGNAIVLGAPNTTSTATTLNVTAAGSITDLGNLTVTGDARFTAAGQPIALDQAGNRFGTILFSGSTVTVVQANDINIVTGSQASQAASFTSGSYITLEDRGGGGVVLLGSTASFNAQGSIVLPDVIKVGGQLTVTSSSLKDLGALSIAGDLAFIAPINAGGGTYVAPQP